MYLSFQDIVSRVETEISKLRFVNDPDSLYAPISYMLSIGGKRIRPALALVACNIYSDAIERSIPPALCVEVFHNFTLMHDDLIDNSDRRRKKPTVHKVWNRNTAVLSGDAMLITAYRLLAESPSPNLKELLDLFTTTALEICEGQQYDLDFESRTDVTEDEYIKMIRLKTAVLLACALKSGAIIGGASEEEAMHLYELGVYIGLAYQLQDDLLDVYGDPDRFGKVVGGDILSNKKTFLLIYALEQASKAQSEEFHRWFGLKVFDSKEKVAVFKRMYDDLGVREATEAKIESYYNKAWEHLHMLQAPHGRLAVLEEVTNFLLHRQA
ncbi:MAG: polyprenyl synthetase family protein [Tannerellaceae bacterium]|jgi:geranylgeranyl diphosphate synthase type II|nr:polyprenyl synthetase family protein [Tannerellaceae bacterium]